MNRGRRGEEIFENSKDFETFIRLLQESVNLWDIRVGAYCLLSNHYHLLIQTPQGNLSRFMRHLNGVYTQRYNRTHDCDGQLFRGRYKAILVEEDNYLLELIRYIHKNPVRAGLVKNVDEYLWSSNLGYLSSAKKWNWLHKDYLLAMFARDVKKRLKTYRKFVAQDDSEEICQVFEKKKLPHILGKDEFIDWVKNRFFEGKADNQVPESVQLAPDVEKIQVAICQYYGVTVDTLIHSERGVINEPRNVAIYLTRLLRRDGLKEISALFGMHGYSPASSAVDRVRKRLVIDKDFQMRVFEVKQMIVS